MKKIFSIVLFFCLIFPTYSQFKISSGMGIDLVYNPSIEEYVNVNFFDPENKLKTFNKSLSVFGELTYSLNEKYQIGLEYNHTFFFYSSTYRNNYNLDYEIYKPTLIGYYVFPGNGYEFKFGGGIGYRYAVLEEKIFSTQEYNSSGVGILFKACGNTALGDNFYAYIGANLRFDYLGEPDANGIKLVDQKTKENVNLNSLSFGIKLGVSYFID